MQATKPALVELRLEVFRDCPTKCLHCYQAQRPHASEIPGPLVADQRRFHALLDEFVVLGGESVSLTGGELLLPSRFPRVLALLADLDAHGVRTVRINTSLAFADEAMLSALAALPPDTLRIQTGLDGPTAHDRIRFPGAQERALSACHLLAKHGVRRLSARTTLFFGHQVGGQPLDNLGDLDWILAACAENGIGRLKTKVVHPSGTLAGDPLAVAVWQGASETCLALALAGLVQTRLDGRTPVRLLLTNPLPSSILPFVLDAARRDPEGITVEACQCGSRHVAVDAEGNVFRCLYNLGRSDLRIGNLRDECLADVLARPARHTYVDRGSRGGCGAFEENLVRLSNRKPLQPGASWA